MWFNISNEYRFKNCQQNAKQIQQHNSSGIYPWEAWIVQHMQVNKCDISY